jgi:hypothetical protein
VVSSGNFSGPYLCGDLLKNKIPFSQNDQQNLPVMKARVRQESSQRKVSYLKQVFGLHNQTESSCYDLTNHNKFFIPLSIRYLEKMNHDDKSDF